MTDITVNATEEALDYMEKIIHEMLILFPITRAEAVGRLNRFWAGHDFINDMAVGLLMHRVTTTWARTIYYGPEAQWWLGEEGLKPDPYP